MTSISLRKELHFIQIRDRIKSVGEDDDDDDDDALLKPRLQRRVLYRLDDEKTITDSSHPLYDDTP